MLACAEKTSYAVKVDQQLHNYTSTNQNNGTVYSTHFHR